MMETYKISLMDAYIIETLRSNGVSDREILNQIELKDVSCWEHLHPKFNFNELIKLADHGKEKFKSIISKGYTIKFVTYPGLQNLLRLKFNKIKDRDYQLIEKGISDLRLKEQEYFQLKQMLSSNWVIYKENIEGSNELNIRIV